MTDASSEPTIKALPSPPKSKSQSRAWISMFALAFILMAAIACGTLYAVYTCPWLGEWLHPSTPQIATNTFARAEDMEALRQRMAALEAKFVPFELSTAKAPETQNTADDSVVGKDSQNLKNEITTLAADLAAAKNEIKANTTATAESRAAEHNLMASILTFGPLRDAALSQHGFGDELAAFHAVTQNRTNLQGIVARLDPLAVKGAPTTAGLHDSLIEREAKIRHAIQNANAEHWWQRVGIELSALISIHPVKGDPATEGVAEIASRLTNDDAAGAVDAFNKLPPAAQKDLADWKQALDARHTINDALHDLSKQLMAAIGSQP